MMLHIYVLFFLVRFQAGFALFGSAAELVKLELTYIMLACKMCSGL